jgi:hypothetical protein
LPWARGTGTYHMHLPRGAISHVLETPITDPQDAAHVLSVDRACKEVHRTSMSESILAFTIRERVRREVPTAGEEGEGRRMATLSQPKDPQHGGRTHHVLICQGPKLTLSKLRLAEAIVDRVGEGCVVSRASWSSAFSSDNERRRLRVLAPFTRRDEVASPPGYRESRGGVVARTVSAGTHSSRRLSVPM